MMRTLLSTIYRIDQTFSMAPKKVTWTPKQLKDWETTRQDVASPTLINPRTGKPIKRDGPTYEELETAYAKYSAKREAMLPDESKAAAPKSKIESALATVMDRTIQTGDRRTAAMLGMINKDLKAAYTTKTATLPAPRKGIELTRELVREMLQAARDSYQPFYHREIRMVPISDAKVDQIRLVLRDTMQQVREMTRTQKISVLLRPSDVKRRPDTIASVVNKFDDHYEERPDPFFIFHENTVRVAVLGAWRDYKKPNAIQKRLIPIIERAYDVPKDVVEFYAVFLSVYAETWFHHSIARAIRRAAPVAAGEAIDVSVENTII